MSCSKDNNNPFKLFLDSWLDDLHTIISQLQTVPLLSTHQSDQISLVSTFMEHQEALFLAKRTILGRDPFVGVSLPWINPLSRALQWFGGWRPVVAYRLVEICHVLSHEQEETLEAMRLITKIEEATIEKQKAQIETKAIKSFVNGKGIASMEAALKATMGKVALAADLARMEAVKRVVDVISPAEAVVYLVELGKMEVEFYGVSE